MFFNGMLVGCLCDAASHFANGMLVGSRAGHSLFISRFVLHSPLNFYPWISIAHFADFQVRSLLNRSKKKQWLSLYHLQANRSKFCFVSSLIALHSFSYWAPSLPKCRLLKSKERLSVFKERCAQLWWKATDCTSNMWQETVRCSCTTYVLV